MKRDAAEAETLQGVSAMLAPTTAPPAQDQNASLAFHPLANMFPLMEGEEFDALVADIKENGLHEPIVLYEAKILDGRNRDRACAAAGVKPTYAAYEGDDPLAFVIRANYFRRHLDANGKRHVIAQLIRMQPGNSDRAVAALVRVDHKTVAAVRKNMVSTGEVSPVDKRIGKDGKARKQPAKKAKIQPVIAVTDHQPDPDEAAILAKRAEHTIVNGNE